MKIYQNSNEPIYKQIASQLREEILFGKLKEGDCLPSIRGLVQDLKISVITTMKGQPVAYTGSSRCPARQKSRRTL